MKKYEKMANEIIEKVGGKDNVTNVLHCMTRLRFNLKDASIPTEEEINEIPGVIGSQYVGGQWQIIIGPDVAKVYKEICEIGGFNEGTIIEENLDSGPIDRSIKGIGKWFLDYLVGSIVPVIPVLIVAGLMKAIMTLCGPNLFNILSVESDTYLLLDFVNNSAFYFLPIYIGYTSAKKLNLNPVIGMFMAAILIHPTFLGLVAEGSGFTVFGISVATVNYTSTIFPVLLSVLIMSYIYKFIEKYMPATLNSLFTPFFTILLMLPIAFIVIAPLGNYAGIYLNDFFMFISTRAGWLTGLIFGAFYQLLVLTGMHMTIAGTTFSLFTEYGYDVICRPGAYVANVAFIGVAFGTWLRFKNQEAKSVSMAAFVSGMFGGVLEPTLYGVALKYRRTLLCGMIAGGLGGLFAGITQVKIYNFGSTPFLYPILYVGGDNMNIVFGVISLLIALISGILLAYFFGLKKEEIGEKEVIEAK